MGVEIKRVEETTISEILNYGLSKHVNYLQEINVSATEEYALENNLTKMKNEWNGILINHETYRFDVGKIVCKSFTDFQKRWFHSHCFHAFVSEIHIYKF